MYQVATIDNFLLYFRYFRDFKRAYNQSLSRYLYSNLTGLDVESADSVLIMIFPVSVSLAACFARAVPEYSDVRVRQ